MALGRVLDDYSLVKFFPLDITSEENIQVRRKLVNIKGIVQCSRC